MKLGKYKLTIPQLLLGCFIALIVLVEARKHGDFKVFIEAAKLLKNRQDMYSPWLDQHCCKYFYSPFFALILIPFVSFPDFAVNFLWLSANVFFFARIWKITMSFFNFSGFTENENRFFSALTLLLTFRFLLHNFEMVQMNVFILWSILESLNLIEKKKNIQGSLLLALAINIKILPIVFLPYLLFRKKIVPCAWVIIFSVSFLFIPALFIGVDYNNAVLLDWFKALNPANAQNYDDVNLGGQSLTSFLTPLLMPTNGELPLKRNIANLDIHTVTIIINAARAFFIGLTLYFTGFTFFKNAKSKLQEFWEISYITLIIPLIFPHQEKYAFILIFPATAYIVYFLIFTRIPSIPTSGEEKGMWLNFSKRKWIVLVTLLCLSFILNTLSSDLFIGKHYNSICQHYRIITYGTFLLTLILPFCNPSCYLYKKSP